MARRTYVTEDVPAVKSEVTDKEMATKLTDGWEEPTPPDELWRNRREFLIPGGSVPQGVARPLKEAYALEVQRLG